MKVNRRNILNKTNLTRIFILVLLLIIPILIIIYRINITKLLYFSDPDYAYIFNGLNINILKLPYYSDHPGVPFTIFIAIGLRFIYWFSGHSFDIQTDVLTNPEYYEWRLHWMLFCTIILSTILLGIFVYKKTKNIPLTITLQSLPFLFDTSLELLSTRLMPDILIILVLQLFIIWFIDYYFKNLQNKSTKKEEFVFSIICGFGLAIKMVFLPFLIFPLLLIGFTIKKIFKFLLISGISFFIFTLPIILEYPRMLYWFFKLFLHTGSYGQGAKSVINPSIFFNNIVYIISNNSFFFILFITTLVLLLYFIILIIIKRNTFQKRIFQYYVFLIITVIVNVVVVAKVYNHKNYYFIVPYFIIAAAILLGIILFFQQIKMKSNIIYGIILFLLIGICFLINFKNYKSVFHGWEISKQEIVELNDFLKPQQNYTLIINNTYSVNKQYALFFGQVFSIVHLEKLKQLYPESYFFNYIPNQFSNWLESSNLKRISGKIFLGDTPLSDSNIDAIKKCGFEPIKIFSNRTKNIYELRKNI